MYYCTHNTCYPPLLRSISPSLIICSSSFSFHFSLFLFQSVNRSVGTFPLHVVDYPLRMCGRACYLYIPTTHYIYIERERAIASCASDAFPSSSPPRSSRSSSTASACNPICRNEKITKHAPTTTRAGAVPELFFISAPRSSGKYCAAKTHTPN